MITQGRCFQGSVYLFVHFQIQRPLPQPCLQRLGSDAFRVLGICDHRQEPTGNLSLSAMDPHTHHFEELKPDSVGIEPVEDRRERRGSSMLRHHDGCLLTEHSFRRRPVGVGGKLDQSLCSRIARVSVQPVDGRQLYFPVIGFP